MAEALCSTIPAITACSCHSGTKIGDGLLSRCCWLDSGQPSSREGAACSQAHRQMASKARSSKPADQNDPRQREQAASHPASHWASPTPTNRNQKDRQGSPRRSGRDGESSHRLLQRRRPAISNSNRDSFIWALVCCPDYIAAAILSIEGNMKPRPRVTIVNFVLVLSLAGFVHQRCMAQGLDKPQAAACSVQQREDAAGGGERCGAVEAAGPPRGEGS